MNQYQKQKVSLKSLLSTLTIPHADEIPNIILSVSPCRSGTTAMLRVIGTMGVPAYFQPLKNLLRWAMQGETFSWALPSNSKQTIYIKETLGPYSLDESTFNPLTLLLQAGVPAHKLHLWIYGRYPLNSYASWLKWWRGKTDIKYFIATHRTIAQIKQQAIVANIATTTLTYEVFDDYPIPVVISKLAQRFGLTYTEKAIKGWQHLPPFGSPASNIILPKEPPAFITPRIHDRVYKATEFTHIASPDSILNAVSNQERQQIESAAIFTLYNQWQNSCLQDLQLANLTGGIT